MTEKYKRPESVLVVIHSADGLILLLKRADIEDFWQSVTGSLRRGEGPRDAAAREVLEETGVADASALHDWRRSVTFEILGRFKSRYAPGTRYNLEHMFSLELDPGHRILVDPREHVRYIWVPHLEAADKVWSWSNRDAIRAVAHRRGWTRGQTG